MDFIELSVGQGLEIRELRKRAGLTLEEAARIMSCSVNKITVIETATRKTKQEFLDKLIKKYKLYEHR